MVPPSSHRIPRVLWYSGSSLSRYHFVYGTFTLSGPAFLPRLTMISSSSAVLNPVRPKTVGLGSFPFARRYSGNRYYFLFLRLLRCFSSPGSLPYAMYLRKDDVHYCTPRSRIRISMDHSSLTAPHSFSQLATSFFGAWYLGIHRMLFVA